LYSAVLKAQSRGSAKYWKKVTVLKKDATVVLECKECGKELSSRNPADSCSNHFFIHEGNMVCKEAAKLQDAAGKGQAVPSSSVTLSGQRGTASTLHTFYVPAAARDRFQREFSRWMLESNTPLARLELPSLKRALASVGLTVPDRRTVGGPVLNSLYFEGRKDLAEAIMSESSFCIAMDGWKKRAAEQGTPIITVMVLLPSGRSAFWKV
jgi:hypothetical protein